MGRISSQYIAYTLLTFTDMNSPYIGYTLNTGS
nr:MAG TPA: hypothetical protein [Caudoviricetes sp.]